MPSIKPITKALKNIEPYSVQDSFDIFNIHKWGKDYFSINEKGNVVVRPERNESREIDLHELVESLQQRGLGLPMLLRFTDILGDRIAGMNTVFQNAIAQYEYKNEYCCIYPIKVNQQSSLVEEYENFSKQYGFGLEAGSKPELIAVLGVTKDLKTPIVCNGFKDDEFIEMVILASKMGKDITPIVEKFSELRLIVKYAKLHGVSPKVGVRVKLAARGSGKWEQSAGVRSKFGLTLPEILEAIEYLRENDMLDCLQMLHFHMGSQITNIRHIKGALIEAGRVFVEMHKLGANMKYIDVGGGLGVDYDGSQTNFESSMNYTLQEYANDVVSRMQTVCDEENVPHPKILSESGRALMSFNSLLVFDVLGTSRMDLIPVPDDIPEDAAAPLAELKHFHDNLSQKNLIEQYHDALQAREECSNLFNLGYLDLKSRAHAEAYFWSICGKVLEMTKSMSYVPDELVGIQDLLSDIYFCNFSLFQSMPDSWAISQLFPVIPIHRHNEEPTRRGILADITCDSDGKIDSFVDIRDVKSTLELHPLKPGSPYYLGAFLIGAYQEILGDLHNLLGDTNTIHVSLDQEGQVAITDVIKGDTVKDVLGYVNYDTRELVSNVRSMVEAAVRNKKLSVVESAQLMEFYEKGMAGYTYLE
ncbi:MAG: biosynthetic arginine decarboxylase [Sumerlaeia bacterium]